MISNELRRVAEADVVYLHLDRRSYLALQIACFKYGRSVFLSLQYLNDSLISSTDYDPEDACYKRIGADGNKVLQPRTLRLQAFSSAVSVLGTQGNPKKKEPDKVT